MAVVAYHSVYLFEEEGILLVHCQIYKFSGIFTKEWTLDHKAQMYHGLKNAMYIFCLYEMGVYILKLVGTNVTNLYLE